MTAAFRLSQVSPFHIPLLLLSQVSTDRTYDRTSTISADSNSTLTEAEMGAVRTVITQMAQLVGSNSSNTEANVAALRHAIQSTVQWTHDSTKHVLEDITATLAKTNPKVRRHIVAALQVRSRSISCVE